MKQKEHESNPDQHLWSKQKLEIENVVGSILTHLLEDFVLIFLSGLLSVDPHFFEEKTGCFCHLLRGIFVNFL